MKSKANTLVEVLLYLGLFGIIFSVAILFTISISQNNNNNDQRARVEKSMIFSNEHLYTSFNKATTLDLANSTFNVDNGKLRLNYAGGYLDYQLTNGRLQISDSGAANYLTDVDVTVSQFLVQQVTDSFANIRGLRITITVSSVKISRISKQTTTFYILN
jgi:type II secretory pathway component PulJ